MIYIKFGIAFLLTALGVALLQHSLNDNFFIQLGLTISGIFSLLTGNDMYRATVKELRDEKQV